MPPIIPFPWMLLGPTGLCNAGGGASAVDLKFLQFSRKLSQKLQIQKPTPLSPLLD
jgi:hypothetical protein